MANLRGLKTFAILAFDGGKCINIAQYPIHFEVNDMQIADLTNYWSFMYAMALFK